MSKVCTPFLLRWSFHGALSKNKVLGVEPHSGSVLSAIDSQDFGVEVEDQKGEGDRAPQEMATESVVEVLEGSQTMTPIPPMCCRTTMNASIVLYDPNISK
jgi:hypothetical protein